MKLIYALHEFDLSREYRRGMFLFCFWNSLSIEIAKVVCILYNTSIKNDEDTARVVFMYILYTNIFKLPL